MTTLRSSLLKALLGTMAASAATMALAIDDGTQMNDPFRINFAGYLPSANKTALYIGINTGMINWKVEGTSCQGIEDTYVTNDFASGDSFYLIDFSACTEKGDNLTLVVNDDRSANFDISDDPYGNLKYEFFDYFQDHQGTATFDQAVNNWQENLSISFSYVKDAGDNGVYPANTAEAAWSLINLLETYPAINTYYSDRMPGAVTVYDQLKVLTEQFNHVFDHGGKLAIPKFHTNVNDTWALCSPHLDGSCISEPETKATFSTARALAAMARIHSKYGTPAQAQDAYQRAVTALTNAQTEPLVCNQETSFGGEGGMYPDNDTFGLYREPKVNRDNCVAHKDNTQDDEYSALVETYLAALVLNQGADANKYQQAVINHPRYDEVSSFWWGAVAMEGSLSLLTHEALHDLDLTNLKGKILAKSDQIIQNQSIGYPGVTWDAQSDQWNNGDRDEADNNFRWGSNRMALNDARIAMVAAEIERGNNRPLRAAEYAKSAIKVLDHMSGINGMNLAMYTAGGYPNIENAVTRTHDGADDEDTWSGKMVLGPNNWTNADDPDMPVFNSLPGLKMFAPTGTGWASREISIDATAALVPVAYFTTEVAPAILGSIQPGPKPTPVPTPTPEPTTPEQEVLPAQTETVDLFDMLRMLFGSEQQNCNVQVTFGDSAPMAVTPSDQ